MIDNLEDIETLSLKELAENLMEIRTKKEDLKLKEKELNQYEELLESKMIETMVDEGSSSVKYPGIGSFSLSTSDFPKIAEDKVFFDYLKNSGQEHMAKYTVNANTLRGWWNKLPEKLDAETIGLEIFTKTGLNIRRS